MRIQFRTMLLLLVGACFIATIQTAMSMPNFARRYNMSCSSCHNPVPRLNDFGFKFRAAGFRLPDDIGKGETSNNLGDYLAARTQVRADYKTSDPGTPNSTKTSNAQMTFHELTVYPISGAYGKDLSSLVELSFLPDNYAEVENGYVRYDYATNSTSFVSFRAGIFHPFEGYGASDRPLGISRPFFQTTTANQNQSSLFTPWGYDEAGVEVGYTMEKTSFRITMFNGILPSGEPAQGGNLSKSTTSQSRDNKDVQLFVNHALTDNGGGLSGYAYFGKVDLTNGTTYKNSFQRYAIYASYPVQKALLLGGYQNGSDTYLDPVAVTTSTFSSTGFFAEANYNISDPLWVGLRFDAFDPSTNKSNNEVNGITAVANYYYDNGLQFIAEYQNKSTKSQAGSSAPTYTKADNTVQVRMIFIF